MLNSLETYRESGRKAAIAVNQGDWARHQFERDYFTRMVALESRADATTARNTWATAYSEARVVRAIPYSEAHPYSKWAKVKGKR